MYLPWGFLGGAKWYHLPKQETQETWVRSLDWEDPLEEGMAMRSSILSWRILWMEEPGSLRSVHGVAQSETQVSD